MSRPAITILRSAAIGGAAANPPPVDPGPSLEDILPYAPKVDRADLAFDVNDTCPQQRVNYPE